MKISGCSNRMASKNFPEEEEKMEFSVFF